MFSIIEVKKESGEKREGRGMIPELVVNFANKSNNVLDSAWGCN